MTADVAVGGAINTLSLNVSAGGREHGLRADGAVQQRGIARVRHRLAGRAPGHWLSVYYGEQVGTVKSFPFSSSTDFGGADLLPPIAGRRNFRQ